eukprot:5450657-Pyramimonas_sp.AAC.1
MSSASKSLAVRPQGICLGARRMGRPSDSSGGRLRALADPRGRVISKMSMSLVPGHAEFGESFSLLIARWGRIANWKSDLIDMVRTAVLPTLGLAWRRL